MTPIQVGDEVRRRLMNALFTLSDRLCHVAVADRLDTYRTEPWRRAVFEIGHQIGELGWKLRRPAGTFTEQEG